MATFENLRLCKQAEYDYFREERLELEVLEKGGLYVAMYSLRRNVGAHGALAAPLRIIEIEDFQIKFRLATGEEKLDELEREMKIKKDNFILSTSTVVETVGSNEGYLRDHREGLDSEAPDADVREKITYETEALAIAVR